MTVELAPEQEAIIKRSIAAGSFNSAEEVLGAAFQLLEEEELRREFRRERLRREVDLADELAADGKVRAFSADEMIQRVRTRLGKSGAPRSPAASK